MTSAPEDAAKEREQEKESLHPRAAVLVLVPILAVFFALVVGEFAVRMVVPQVTLFPRYVRSADYYTDFPRNSTLIHSRGRLWRFEYNTNELGRRGRYVEPSAAAGTDNVVVLGDSFTFGIGVMDSEVYSEILAETLGGGFSVINGGMGGWGLDSEIKWYYQNGEAYSPKFVVLQFTANDPRDYLGLTTIEDGRFEFHSFNDPKPEWQWFLSSSGLIQRSHLYSLVRSVLGDLVAAGPGRVAEEPSEPSEEEVRAFEAVQQQRYADMLDLFASQLAEREIRLIFVSVTAGDRGGEAYGYDVQNFPIIEAAVQRQRESGHLVFVDLPLDAMAEAPGSPEGHQWGTFHHEVVGKRIAETIRALELD